MMRNLKVSILKQGHQLSSTIKKNFIVKYPEMSVRIDKKTGDIVSDEVKGKKVDEVRYTTKMEVDPENLDDYHIIGAEIFKNAYKDSLERGLSSKNKEGNLIDTITEEELQKEIYSERVKELKWQEPNKWYKHFTRRTFYDYANPEFRHMFVPSYRYKIEPFNAIHTFRFGHIDGNRTAHKETLFNRNSYVQSFSPPFTTNNPEVDKLINELSENQQKHNLNYGDKDFHNVVNDLYNDPRQSSIPGVKEYVETIDKFVDLVPNLSHKIFPTLLLKVFFELGLNSKKLWIAIEQEVMNNLHHYTSIELSQINFAATVSSPKFTSDNFRRVLLNTIYHLVDSKTLPLEDLHAVALGCRMTKNRLLYNNLAENFISRKNEFVHDKSAPKNLANILYSWTSHKPKKDGPTTFYPQRDLEEKFIETYEDDLNDNIMKMNQEEVWRLASSLYLLKNDNVDPFINRIERNLLKLRANHPEKLDPFALHNVIRAFSKMKNNKMSGSDRFFDQMEEIVISHIENFKYSFQQITDILYAYSVRSSGSDKLYKLLNKKLNEDIDKANNYHMLHNIAWYYLFNENKNLEEWGALMDKYNQLEGRLPIYYYRPFKIASYYIENAFTEDMMMKLGHERYAEFKDRFFDPEQVYDYVKYEKLFYKHPEYSSLKAMVNGRLILFPINHFVYKNLFMIHLCWEDRLIGINVWLDHNKVPKSSPARVNQKDLLHAKMLKYEGWQILDIIWEDFINMGGQADRDKYLHDWYNNTSAKQEQKGVYKSVPKFI